MEDDQDRPERGPSSRRASQSRQRLLRVYTADWLEQCPFDGLFFAGQRNELEELANWNPKSDWITILNQQLTYTMHSQLAKQLEYYFSEQNLSKDTYLQRLRDLNDGCVPLIVLANFAKVQVLTNRVDESERQAAVIHAIQEYSEVLCVYRIDRKTSKVLEDLTDGSHTDSHDTILAVGTHDRRPLPGAVTVMPSPLAAVQSPEASSVVNTLILRDVDPVVTCDDVRLLFESLEGCPKIISVRPDVAYCWYVLDWMAFKQDFTVLWLTCMLAASTGMSRSMRRQETK